MGKEPEIVSLVTRNLWGTVENLSQSYPTERRREMEYLSRLFSTPVFH